MKPSKLNTFFSLSVQEWISWNAQVKAGNLNSRRIPWQKLFTQVYWNIWKAHCKRLFSEDTIQDIDIIFSSTQQVINDMRLQSKVNTFTHEGKRFETRWRPPDTGWICLDVDGVVNSNGAASCGGIMRDDKGN